MPSPHPSDDFRAGGHTAANSDWQGCQNWSLLSECNLYLLISLAEPPAHICHHARSQKLFTQILSPSMPMVPFSMKRDNWSLLRNHMTSAHPTQRGLLRQMIVQKSLVQIMCSQGSWALPRSWDLRPQWKPQVQQRGSGMAFHNPVPLWLFRQRKITAKCKKKLGRILAKQLSSIWAALGWVRQGTHRRQDWHLLLRWRRRWQP